MSALRSNPYSSSKLSREGWIRLLKVQPEANENQEIQCSLETVHLTENPDYVALSYTWGPPTAEAFGAGVTSTPTHSIRCNGDVILITQNLHDFIRRVCRDPELNSHRFWVDSICINQQDPTERSIQVSFMASIYRLASMVIAWLGEEDIYTEESFALIRALATLCKDCRKRIMPRNMGSEIFEIILGPLADIHIWMSLRQFWRRKYFKRAWIIQEVALAKKVVVKCGSHTLDWNHIVRASLFLTVTPWVRFLNSGTHEPVNGEYSNHALPLYIDANSKLDKSGECRTLLYALIRARRFECSDLRDKVYALLGLVTHQTKGKRRLQPSYGDHSVFDTYVSAAIQMLEDTDDLLLLAHVEGKDFQMIENLPSWVPDWSCAKGLGLGILGYKRFRAAGNLPRCLKVDESNMSLALRGLQLDRIVQVGESKDGAPIHSKPAYFPGWISILSALPPIYHNGQPKAEAFWRTLITDTAARDSQHARHPAAEEFGLAFRNWLRRIVLSWMDKSPSKQESCFIRWVDRLGASDEIRLVATTADKTGIGHGENPFSHSLNNLKNKISNNHPDADDYDAILNHSSQTRLLRTSTNYLGLATTSIREGDTVWILSGSRVPIILRESNSPNQYHIVGGAYIHGLMQGETLVTNDVFVEIKVA